VKESTKMILKRRDEKIEREKRGEITALCAAVEAKQNKINQQNLPLRLWSRLNLLDSF
jgi:hypothetical protein